MRRLHDRRVTTCLAALMLAAPLAACDTDDEDIDVMEGEDPEYRGGSGFLYHKLLAKWVRFRAYKQGFEPMPEAPEVRDELFELGKVLAFDKELSGNRDISCMTCHHPDLSTDDDNSLSIGVGGVGLGADRVHPDGIFIPRNATPLFNLHAMETMFWDGRVSFHGGELDTPAKDAITPEMIEVFEFGAVSAQAMFPVTSRAEMRGKMGTNEVANIGGRQFQDQWAALMDRLGQYPEYVQMFEAAYPGTDFEDMTFAHAANAIAGYEIRAFEATETPWDDFLKGDDWALSLDQLQGANHFLGKAQCSECHTGAAMTDLDFHNTALGQFGPGKNNGGTVTDDWGRYNVHHEDDHFFGFRTAPLRNVEITGPWGHAGQYTDLDRFIGHYLDVETAYNNYQAANEGVVPELADTQLPANPLLLNHVDSVFADEDFDFRAERLDEMVAFMQALTDPNSYDLDDTIPETVPSGHPIADDVLVVPDNYAGSLSAELRLPGSSFREYQLQRPEMCDGGGTVTVTFDENENYLALDAHIEGLPYRPSACFEYDPSTPWNAYPDCVEDGKWQIWFVPRLFNVIVPFYYDLNTGDLITSGWEVEEAPPNSLMVPLPAGQMVESPLFEADPNTLVADIHFEWEYDHILDDRGTAGALFSVLPKNIFNPFDLDIYYSQGGLDPKYAISWRDMIEQNNEGRGGFAIAMSLEPDPKPDYLASRDNIMLGFSASIPDQNPEFANVSPVPCGQDFQWPQPGEDLVYVGP